MKHTAQKEQRKKLLKILLVRKKRDLEVGKIIFFNISFNIYFPSVYCANIENIGWIEMDSLS